jgi:hypothetical protein
MKTFKLAHTLAAMLGLCAGFAQASQIVTTWGVTDTAVFVPATLLPAGGYPNPVLSVGNTQLHWGAATQQSGLIITNSGVQVSAPTGVITPTVQVTHDNFPIPAGNSLTSVDIFASLSLVSISPTTGNPLPASINFGVRFLETPNLNPGQTCADGGISGAPGVNVNSCADLFVISNDSLNSAFFYDSDGAINGYDPEPYYVSFFADGFNPLSNAACASVGAANGCYGFETPENLSTTAQFMILITSTPFQTPEPGSMALMSGALAALAWVGRRRKQRHD